MIANDHGGTSGGSKSTNGHSVSASKPIGPGSGLKTATGTAETAHGQRRSVTSPGESALIHETANRLWSERATRETASEHDIAVPEIPVT